MTHLRESAFAQDMRRWASSWAPSDVPRPAWVYLRLLWSHQPLRATALLRLSNYCSRRKIPALPNMLRRLNITLHGIDVVPGLAIGGGLYLPHTVGTVVMASWIGRNVTLVSNVTIGMRGQQAFPVIGNDVFVGAGARILGAVVIGDGARIGANAVVLTDVPAGATAVGVPARIVFPGAPGGEHA